MIALQGLRPIKASLPPLSEDAAIKAENKWKMEANVEALATCKRSRLQRKREKKAARLALVESGRSISPSIDTEDMTSTASSGVGPQTSVGDPSHDGDLEASSSVLA